MKSVADAPPHEHTVPGIYRVEDAVIVNTPHGRCSRRFIKGTVTILYNAHSVLTNGRPCHIMDLRARQRSTLSEDDGSDRLPESGSDLSLFFGTAPEYSSTEHCKQILKTSMMMQMKKDTMLVQLQKKPSTFT